jgi:mono/diheme cytochrome c family protein
MDLDAPHPSAAVPSHIPVSTVASRQLLGNIGYLQSVQYYRSHSPSEAWKEIRAVPVASALNDQVVWNLTASLWQANTNPAALRAGARLYSENCAACHGPQGDGGGVFAGELAASTTMTRSPADFAAPATMLGASPALLQGKILRGGMGTGMPSWGPIFTDQQTWDLVAYLYTFQFTYR